MSSLPRASRCLQALKRLGPAIAVFIELEESSSASSEVFLERFGSFSAFYWKLFHAFEACLGDNDISLLLPFEGFYHRINLYSAVSCDGPDRRIRPTSQKSLHAWLRGWGLHEVPILPQVLPSLQRLLKNFPEDFGTSKSGNILWLTHKGLPLAHGSCWVWT